MRKKALLLLIESELEKILSEQDETVSKDVAADDVDAGGAAVESGNDETVDVQADDNSADSDLDDATTPGDGELGDIDIDSDDSADGETDVDASGLSTGGPGGGWSGGGDDMNFGDEGETGLGADEEEEVDTLSTIGPEDVEIPANPVMAITDDAIEMLNHTKQPGPILQNIKHSIQKYFPEPGDATPIIKNLWDTEDLILRDVARRLLTFIKGV